MLNVLTVMWDRVPRTALQVASVAHISESAARDALAQLYDRGVVRKDGRVPPPEGVRGRHSQLWVIQPTGAEGLFGEPDR